MIRMRYAARKVAFISSFPPRRCGIATFTSDLIKNLALAAGHHLDPVVIAMQPPAELTYDNIVKLRIRKDVAHDYPAAADYINRSDIDLVSVQHEFGLFGGEAGSYLTLLLDRVKKPIITTLHTVLETPSPEYFDSMIDLCRASNKLIVMNKRGIGMLQDIYGVPEQKIELIPHGIPDLPFVNSNDCKHSLGLAGRKTILTFGLLGRNKGIEVMLKALPRIVEADPSVLYIVLGATHPEVLRHEGQSYKVKLEEMVRALRLHQNVLFYNRFVEDKELFQFLCATDVYVTPYLHREQLTSGTLAFAVGTGKAVVSTPYWAAEELLAQGRGRLVQFGDSESMAQAVVEILTRNTLFSIMRKRAYEYGRSMTWPTVGQSYWRLFETVTRDAIIPAGAAAIAPGCKLPDYSSRQAYQPAPAV
ncbi:MAG TPA: glycosyltransferase family 4 protein [Sedimentisphaerales bacterium]|nr:glycosyltransferase family 4 protein [Sedimentisphaerales bacterium]